MAPKADSRGMMFARVRERRLATALAALASVAIAGSGAVAETQLTDIPLPRLNPQRVHSDAILSYAEGDPIGGLLTGAVDDDQVSIPTTEDAEPATPEFTPVIAAKPRAPSSKSDIGSVGLRYAIKFLDEGQMPFERVGSHRRVKLSDLLEFRRRRREEQYAALSTLSGEVDEDRPLEEVLGDLKAARRAVAAKRRNRAGAS